MGGCLLACERVLVRACLSELKIGTESVIVWSHIFSPDISLSLPLS